jgi:hypothetical protein
MSLSYGLQIIVSNLTVTRQIVYKSIILQKIAEFYTKRFSICPNITLKFRPTAILKSSVKELMIQIKLLGMSIIVH